MRRLSSTVAVSVNENYVGHLQLSGLNTGGHPPPLTREIWGRNRQAHVIHVTVWNDYSKEQLFLLRPVIEKGEAAATLGQ